MTDTVNRHNPSPAEQPATQLGGADGDDASTTLDYIIDERQPSPIFRSAARYLVPLLLMFSIFVLLRGHDSPGGGFIGGLVAAAALTLFAIAYGTKATWAVFRPLTPWTVAATGLLSTLIAGVIPLFAGQPLLTGLWFKNEFPPVGKIGTPLLFDVGVYLVVVGITMQIVLSLIEES